MATRGRRKRARAKSAGSAVKVKSHTRTPRGPNTGKAVVKVDGYGRGKPAKTSRGKKSRSKRK